MKKFILLDLICYVALPYFIWTYGREPLGDYYAMLLSTVPGFLYTIYRFSKERQFNIAGLSILLSLFLGTMVNLLSGSAENLLWNQVYLGYAFGLVYLISILVKKPLALQFAVDFVYLQGMPKKESTALFSKKPIFFWFQLLTGLFFFTSLFQNSFKAWLIHSYGVDGYGEMLLYLKASGWFFYGLSIAGFFLIGHKINNQPEQAGTSDTLSNSQENLQAEKNALSAQDHK
ncbi:hypothetical protein ON064_08905 [Planococcus sp. A6]|uniref:VC0807 family protein n=1 Tax=Planococcus sp. A6 TaxID=2992760 RepID=UPI00237C29EF|nr:VC0807 family protein [Planococcus sp. A6]MDE0583155.1 hypothetical protein [Planococcus sp. A6]